MGKTTYQPFTFYQLSMRVEKHALVCFSPNCHLLGIFFLMLLFFNKLGYDNKLLEAYSWWDFKLLPISF